MGMFDSVKNFWDNTAGGLFAGDPDRPDTSAEDAARQRAIDELKGKLPTNFESYDYLGDYNPELIGDLPTQGQTEFSKIAVDPSSKAAQMQALQALQDRAATGYSVEDQAAINQIQAENAQQEKSQRDALMANMQARGQGGSGAELAQQLAAQQGSATRNNQAGLDVASEGRRRALEAVMASGQLGGQMRAQDYGEQADRAKAQDAINNFNTQVGVNKGIYNNKLVNDAGMAGWGARQATADKNTAGRNDFKQQDFANNSKIADMQYGHATAGANEKLAQYGQDVAARDKGIDRTIEIAKAGAEAYGKKG